MKRLLIPLVLALAALVLTACIPSAFSTAPSTSAPSTSMPSTNTMPPAGAPPPAYTAPTPLHATPAPTHTPPATMLRSVHSPGVVLDDMHSHRGACHVRDMSAGPLPDPTCTPGAYDPTVTQATIKTTICMSGWTATVRPPAGNTSKWKRTAEAAYGDPAGFTGEYDHLVPLELGGANSTSNLWPEPGAIPNAKDRGPERHLHDAVCAGKMTLAKAQAEIATDWTTAAW